LGQCEHLVEDAGHERAYTDLFDQFGMVGSLKYDAGRMESDWSILVSGARRVHPACPTYPIIRSYCCCRMFGETLQSTWPEPRVMDSASAMSD